MLARSKRQRESTHGRALETLQGAAPILGASWNMVIATLLGALVGWWLDGRFGLKPWLLIVGALLGAGAGLFSFVRSMLALSKRDGQDRPDTDGKEQLTRRRDQNDDESPR